MATKSARWYPSRQQLGDPAKLELALRQVLKQHYDLQDRFAELHAKVHSPVEKSVGFPPGSGPADTMLLGLHVLPVDTQTLADGATLKFVKAQANFQFQ